MASQTRKNHRYPQSVLRRSSASKTVFLKQLRNNNHTTVFVNLLTCKFTMYFSVTIPSSLIGSTYGYSCFWPPSKLFLFRSFTKHCPTLQQHWGRYSSSSNLTQGDCSCKTFASCAGTILLLVASLWKTHFPTPFRETPDAILMAMPATPPRVSIPVSPLTMPTSWVGNNIRAKTSIFYSAENHTVEKLSSVLFNHIQWEYFKHLHSKWLISYLEVYKEMMHWFFLFPFFLNYLTNTKYMISSSTVTSKSTLLIPQTFPCMRS